MRQFQVNHHPSGNSGTAMVTPEPFRPRWWPALRLAAPLAAACLLGIVAQPVAAVFLFQGFLAEDDGVQFFRFELTTPSQVSFSTSSFAAGGLLPVLSFWDGSGVFGGALVGGGGGPPDDVYFNIDLTGASPGNYWLALSQYPNVTSDDLPGGLPTTSIFSYAGQGNFTGGLYCSGPYSGGFFIPGVLDCEQRTGNWALSIDGPGVSAAGLYPQNAPVPATALLILAGLGALAGHRRRPEIRERPGPL